MYEPGVVIRRPVEQDLDALAELILRFYRFNEEFDPAWALARDAADRAREVAKSYVEGKGYTLVASVDGALAGYIHAEASEYPLLENKVQAVITELYVKPQFRGRGIATMLVDRIIEIARDNGINVVTAMFPAANFVAEHFYKSRKFRRYLCIYLREV